MFVMKKLLLFISFFTLSLTLLLFASSCKKNAVERDDYLEEENISEQINYDNEYNVNYQEIAVTAYYGSSDSYKRINCVYSDEVFFNPANQYNHFLARMSMGLALASYTAEGGDISSSDSDLNGYLINCGFEDFRMDEYYQETSMYTVASMIGHKEIQYNGETATLVVIGIRSGKYYKEWMSNFNVDEDNGLHAGFNHAATLITDRALSYIDQYNFTGKIKVWVAGFSRGAAIANLTAAKLNNVERVGKDNIYAYTFATPRGVANDPDQSLYDNIFNIIGPSDPVTQFAPSDWGYKRFGIDLYLPGSEFNSDFSKVYAKVQAGVESMGFKTSYNAALNLRVRLLIGYLAEFVGYESFYSAYSQREFISIIGEKSLDVIIRSLKQIMDKCHEYVDAFDPGSFDRLIDYIIATAMPLFKNNNYLSGDEISATSSFRQLMHEHYPELYYYMVYCSSPDELYFDNDEFAYVLLDEDTKYELYDNNNLVLTVDEKGNKILSEYALANYLDIQLIAFKNCQVLVLPYDHPYELKYQSTKNTEIKYVEYSREFKSFLELKTKQLSEGSGTALKINSQDMDDSGFESKEIRSSDFASTLKINKVGLTWRVKLIILVALFVVLLSIVPIIAYGLYVLISKDKFKYMHVINIVLLAIICFEEELYYWFFEYSLPLYLVWKLLIVAGTAIALIAFKKDKLKNIFDSLIPFVLLGIASIFLIDKYPILGLIFLGLAAIYLFIYLLRAERLKTKQIALAVMITIILEALNIGVFQNYFYHGLIIAFIIPFLSLIFLMVSNKDDKLRTVAYLFILCIILAGVFYSSNRIVIPHLLFKLALFSFLICASFFDLSLVKVDVSPMLTEQKE